MSDDGFSLLEIVIGIGLLALVLGLFVGMSGGIKPDQSMLPARVRGYTPVQLDSSKWNQIPAAERTAFGITDENNHIVMVISGTRDKWGVCKYFIEEEPQLSTNELIDRIIKNPAETGSRAHLIGAAEACYALYPAGIGDPPEVLSVIVSNISDEPVLYNPGNFHFQQYQAVVIPIPKYRLLGEEKFTHGGVLAPGESISGGIFLEDTSDLRLNFNRALGFWYGHNYGIFQDF